MDQNALKRIVAQAALSEIPDGALIGVGTGSTVNAFIDALAASGKSKKLAGAVSSSRATSERLTAIGVPLLDANEVEALELYIDGADEIDSNLCMIKGGGGALTREKIVAAISRRFLCICDFTKRVERLGRFPLPIEVIPMARTYVARELRRLGGQPKWREGFITDNGNHILDVAGLTLDDPLSWEQRLNNIPGVVTNGIFAQQAAHLLLLATPQGIERYERPLPSR
ncbi:MAG: ribose-5-phosphate isomerase RpiA [Hydrogenophilus sp.]|nr:ribose-5-phosphate isomerase RpiA [Hydrogenophilus sp.]